MRNRILSILGAAFLVVAALGMISCSKTPTGPLQPPPWVFPQPPNSIVINVSPDSLQAHWTINGPGGYSTSGNGDVSLLERAAGAYVLEWETIAGWATPDPAIDTQWLQVNGALTFDGTYVAQTGTISIDPNPLDTAAPWQLTGPGGFTRSGTGDSTLVSMFIGDYTLTWGPMAGWAAPIPASDTRTLILGGVLTFIGPYIENTPDGFVSIPAGTFTMGSPASESGRSADETQHQVTLTHGLFVQATEVTNQQYRDLAQWAYDRGYVMATSGGIYDNLDGSGQALKYLGSGKEMTFSDGVFSCVNPTHPVEFVTWYGSAAYCDWLSMQRGLPRAYDHGTWLCNAGNPYTASGYRLPTEAEWEYACRSGTQDAFNTGPCLDAQTAANHNGTFPYAGCPSGPNRGWTVPVGSYSPNAFGLYDMHGNVMEWCNDSYGAYGGNVTDPVATEVGTSAAIRGGSWIHPAVNCRSAHRIDGFRPGSDRDGGFRPVRSIN